MKRLLKWVLWGFIGLVVLAIVANMLTSPEEKAKMAEERAERAAAEATAKAEAAKQEAANMLAVTAVDISRAYEENTVAADARFKGKKFKVTGVVDDINTDITGDPYLTLRGVNQFLSGHYGFDKGHMDQLAKVRKGQRVTLVCTGRGDIAKTPMSDDCSMVD